MKYLIFPILLISTLCLTTGCEDDKKNALQAQIDRIEQDTEALKQKGINVDQELLEAQRASHRKVYGAGFQPPRLQLSGEMIAEDGRADRRISIHQAPGKGLDGLTQTLAQNQLMTYKTRVAPHYVPLDLMLTIGCNPDILTSLDVSSFNRVLQVENLDQALKLAQKDVLRADTVIMCGKIKSDSVGDVQLQSGILVFFNVDWELQSQSMSSLSLTTQNLTLIGENKLRKYPEDHLYSQVEPWQDLTVFKRLYLGANQVDGGGHLSIILLGDNQIERR